MRAKRAIWVAAAAASVALALIPACNARGGRERREERRDEWRDRRAEALADWEKLGERIVDGRNDRDAILVTAAEGRFEKLMLKVEHSALELYNIVVHFGDGSTFSPETRLVFAEDSRSRVIDLPGGRRVIRRVDFRYGNLPGGGRAQIELWGR